MPWRTEPATPWIDRLAILGGFVMLFDTLWGGLVAFGAIAFGGLDSLWHLVIIVALVGGLPSYLLDGRSSRRTIILLPALFLLRLLTTGWRSNLMVVPAAVLLQWYKWQTAEAR